MQPPDSSEIDSTFDPYRNVPVCFHDLLVPLNGPTYHESCQDDLRRYTLLHRRFTNQILYGCRDASCNTRTCLTFRKRTSTKPVRPHTKAAAQALATYCVQRLANNWREIADEEEAVKRWENSGKVPSQRTRQLHGTGLCENDGVVPWYEDGEKWLRDQDLKQYGPAKVELSVTAPEKYDNASVMQFVARLPKVQAICSLSQGDCQDADGPEQQQPETCDVKSCKTSRRVFNELPSSALLWLVCESRNRRLAQTRRRDKDMRNDGFNNFIIDSLSHCLCDPTALIRSASAWTRDLMLLSYTSDLELQEKQGSALHFDIAAIRKRELEDTSNKLPPWSAVQNAFRVFHELTFQLVGLDFVMRCILKALQQCYTMPDELRGHDHHQHNASLHTFLTNSEVAHLIFLTLNIVTAPFRTVDDIMIAIDFRHQQTGKILACHKFDNDDDLNETSIFIDDNFWMYAHSVKENSKTIADIIAHRLAVDRSLEHKHRSQGRVHQEKFLIATIIDKLLDIQFPDPIETQQYPFNIEVRLLQIMRTVVIVNWDHRPVIKRTSALGGAIEMMAGLYRSRHKLALEDANFYRLRFVADIFKDTDVLYQWLSFIPNPKHMHILQHPYLFKPKRLVRFFRAMNLKIMQDSYMKARTLETIAIEHMVRGKFPVPAMSYVLNKVRPGMAQHFVMTISRSNVLEDAIGQVWRRERQELLRPLKVKLGQEDGEEGIDYGGVQQEFFRLVFAEAFDVKYGMFDVDPTTYMTWFKPGSLEPWYKFEVLGILMGLAVYNGITLPITMPIAFYRMLLFLKVDELDHIRDGWPELSRSLKILLDWTDGDVADSIGRTYEFSYDAFGQVIDIDMSKTSKLYAKVAALEIKNGDTTNTEAPVVNNQTRHAYVADYIRYLTKDSVEAQLGSFLRGFHTILEPKVLSIFEPETLRLLIEGQPQSQPLDMQELQAATAYEEYSADSPVIQWFWQLVEHEFTEEQKRKLLMFVTASDRVPIGGLKDVRFVIQRDGTGEATQRGSEAFTLDDHSVQDSDFGHEEEENRHDWEHNVQRPRPTSPSDVLSQTATPANFGSSNNDNDSGLPQEHLNVAQSQSVPETESTEVIDIPTAAGPDILSVGIRDESPGAQPALLERTKKEAIRLPGSSTCYGRLLLPAYSNKEILREKLCLAIENSMGFGVL